MMNESLRILILEDNPNDAELMQFELEESGLNFTAKVVAAEREFVRELADFSPDLILSDYDLPKYNGSLALAAARRRRPDTPFILVTGALVEDRAIEILTQGAKDYVLKTRIEQRLVPAVKRALAEAAEHKARKQAEEELRAAHRTLESKVKERTRALEESEERLRFALETIHVGAWDLDLIDHTAFRSLEHDRIFGYEDLLPRWTYEMFLEHVLPEDRSAVDRKYQHAIKNKSDWNYECRIRRTDGEVRWIWAAGRHQFGAAGEVRRMAGIVQDITERKKAEEALRYNKAQLDLALMSVGMGMWYWDIVNKKRYFDNQVCYLLGIDLTTFTGAEEEFFNVVHPDDLAKIRAAYALTLEKDMPYEAEYRVVWPDGSIHYINSHGFLVRDEAGQPLKINGIIWDVTERKMALETKRH